MTAVVCDLDGVVYLGTEPVPGAAAALQVLERSGVELRFCTNNSSRTPAATADKIRTVTGFDVSPEQVVTSAQAAAHLLAGRVGDAFVVGGAGIRQALRDVGIREASADRAEAVVVGLDVELSYGTIRDAGLAVRRGARFVATNLDATFPTPGGLWPGAGSIAAAIATAGGRQPEVAGKPHVPMIELVRSGLTSQGEVVVVGDRIETDIGLGAAAGWRTVLVLTGVSETAPSEPCGADAVLPSLADLPSYLAHELQWEVM